MYVCIYVCDPTFVLYFFMANPNATAYTDCSVINKYIYIYIYNINIYICIKCIYIYIYTYIYLNL